MSHILFLRGSTCDAVDYIRTLATDVFARVVISCGGTGEGVLFDQDGTKLALGIVAKSFGARGGG